MSASSLGSRAPSIEAQHPLGFPLALFPLPPSFESSFSAYSLSLSPTRSYSPLPIFPFAAPASPPPSLSSPHSPRSPLPSSPSPSPTLTFIPGSTTFSTSPSSASSPSSPSAPPPTRRRRRTLTSSERIAQRKAKHQRLDASRRAREAAVLDRLHRLSTQRVKGMGGGGGARGSGGGGGGGEEVEGEAVKRVDKVTELERAAERLEQLLREVEVRRVGEEAKDRQIRSLLAVLQEMRAATSLDAHSHSTATALLEAVDPAPSSPFIAECPLDSPTSSTFSSPFPSPPPSPSASDADASTELSLEVAPSPATLPLASLSRSELLYLAQLDRSLCLSVVVRSPIALMLISILHFTVLDTNHHHDATTGFSLSDLQHKAVIASSKRPSVPVAPLTKKVSVRGGCVQVRYATQSMATKRAVHELMTGVRTSVQVQWRMWLGDGGLYDVQVLLWQSGEPWMEGPGRCKHPHRYLIASGTYDSAFRVDDS